MGPKMVRLGAWHGTQNGKARTMGPKMMRLGALDPNWHPNL